MVLSTILAQPDITSKTIPIALQVYDEVRRPFAQEVVRRSYRTGERMFLQCARVEGVTVDASAAGKVSLGVMEEIGAESAELLLWTWSTTIDGDLQRAADLVRAKVAEQR